MCVEEQSQYGLILRSHGRREGILHPRAEHEEHLRAIWLSCSGSMWLYGWATVALWLGCSGSMAGLQVAMTKLQVAMTKLQWGAMARL